jgi:hypothetical protein
MYFLPAAPSHSMKWWRRGSKNQAGPGVLVHDTPDDDLDNVPFRWIRAPEAEMVRKRRARTIGALVLVTATLSAGVLLGRLSNDQRAGHHDHNAFLKLSLSPQPIAAPVEAVANSLAERLPPLVPIAAMALTYTQPLEVKTIISREIWVPGKSSSSVTPLNPHSTETSRQRVDQPPSLPESSNIATESLATLGGDPRQHRQLPPKSSNPDAAKNHKDLRDFVLSSRWYALKVARNRRATY